jgi:hypothetical protein
LKIINFIYADAIVYFMRKEIKENVLALAIAVIFVFFVGVGIKTFYDLKEEYDYCNLTYNIDYSRVYDTENSCTASNGKWMDISSNDPKCEGTSTTCPKGYCDVGYYCREEYKLIREKHDRNVFIIAAIIGVLTIFLALFLIKEAVKTGLMGGGLLTIIYGVIRYWNSMQNWIRFIVLGIVLIFLVWVGYKKIEEGQNAEIKKNTEKSVIKKANKRKR